MEDESNVEYMMAANFLFVWYHDAFLVCMCVCACMCVCLFHFHVFFFISVPAAIPVDLLVWAFLRRSWRQAWDWWGWGRKRMLWVSGKKCYLGKWVLNVEI
jgi:hypothetical protein